MFRLPVKTTQISLDEFSHIPQNTFFIDDEEEYDLLCKTVKDWINADCRALTINDEIIFNSYNDTLPFREQILENTLRFEIAKGIHRNLFCMVHRQKKEAIIRIYMMEEPHLQLIEVHFDPERMVYFLMIYKAVFE